MLGSAARPPPTDFRLDGVRLAGDELNLHACQYVRPWSVRDHGTVCTVPK
jgi:hypothetical protein